MRYGAALSFIRKGGASDGSKADALGTPLTFTITNTNARALLESDKAKFRSIGVSGNNNVYLMDLVSFDQGQMRALELTKAKVIAELMDRQDAGANPFGYALKVAAGSLAQRVAQGLVPYFSYVIAHDTAGFGPISMLLEDSGDIEEIEINSPASEIAVYHRRYGRCATNIKFNSELDFRYTINKMAAASGAELTSANPIVDVQVGNLRIHAQTRPYSPVGGSASIRVGHPHSVGFQELMLSGAASPAILAYFWMAIEVGKNIVIAGAPGSGKTTLMSVISSFFEPATRIIVIEEDISEIALPQSLSNVVRLQGSSRNHIGFKEQIKNALHMSPNALIVGEIRGDEAGEVFAGANVGVPFFTTMHSDGDGNNIISRLRANPMRLEDNLITNLAVSVFMRHDKNGARVVESITEYFWGPDGASRPKLLTIASDGELDTGSIMTSEVIRKYSEINGIEPGNAVRELGEREKRLRESTSPVYAEVMAK